MMKTIASVIVALVLVAIPAAAQDRDQIADEPPDQQAPLVRVHTEERPRRVVVGELGEEDEMGLTIRVGALRTPVYLRRDSVTRIEQHGPRPPAQGFFRGAGFGLLVGAAGGAALGLVHGADPPFCDCLKLSAKEHVVAGVLVGGVVGGGLGAVVGLAFPGETWRPRRAARRAQVTLLTPPQGLGARVSVRF